ncbi:tail protein [Mycobacterium phage Hawkeye]|uniref:JAB domain-containing protein n=1 Tax=Mycobacterium phage Hawkeye TaxID=1458711 RepID=X2KRF1_9CAUD|nr:tail protein [Mycobacterium phage Hawkeye]AHN84023.1 hypothetical protein PBI_HAWKEYE_12 [Mycobacterium phage Hawkeye]
MTETAELPELWTKVKLNIPEDAARCLVNMCNRSPQAEICGFITSDFAILPVSNVSDDPSNEFVMDQAEMMRALFQSKIIGTYHSHPSGRPWPSTYDTNHIGFLYAQGCPWDYYIVTNAGVFQYEHRDRQRMEDESGSGEHGGSCDAEQRPDRA